MSNYKQNKNFLQYKKIFPQYIPRYAIKPIGTKKWIMQNKPLHDSYILQHLTGKINISCLGTWYNHYALLDVDSRDRGEVEEIRERLKLDTDNSMLFSSESKDSYHCLFSPTYNKKPPTLRLLNEILKPFAKENGVEIYPQPNKTIRLPFGYNQRPLDFEYVGLKDWEEYLYWFLKLDSFDLKSVPQQLRLELKIPKEKSNLTTYQEGKYLYLEGLQLPSSRHESQFKVLYWLWRNNVPLPTAISLVWDWIKVKHNGFSKQIIINPKSVLAEIQRQANHIYETYHYSGVYPDNTHNTFYGFITKEDINDIIIISEARLPKAKFSFNLIKYCNPRRYQTFVQLHRDSLVEWSSTRTYLKNLDELQAKGIVKRYDSYKVDEFSKSIKINWKFKDIDKAILVDNRAPESFEDTIKACYKPEEFRELLIRAGSERTNAIKAVKNIFEV